MYNTRTYSYLYTCIYVWYIYIYIHIHTYTHTLSPEQPPARPPGKRSSRPERCAADALYTSLYNITIYAYRH